MFRNVALPLAKIIYFIFGENIFYLLPFIHRIVVEVGFGQNIIISFKLFLLQQSQVKVN